MRINSADQQFNLTECVKLLHTGLHYLCEWLSNQTNSSLVFKSCQQHKVEMNLVQCVWLLNIRPESLLWPAPHSCRCHKLFVSLHTVLSKERFHSLNVGWQVDSRKGEWQADYRRAQNKILYKAGWAGQPQTYTYFSNLWICSSLYGNSMEKTRKGVVNLAMN